MDSAVARYRALRQSQPMAGRWDFGEWETNLWAEALARRGLSREAIAAYLLNLEFFPQSGSILVSLGQLYEPTDRARAIEYYEKALVQQPGNPELLRRLTRLKGDTAHRSNRR
jgi:tetratricopeptide (TPR) repeat protein